MKLLRAVNIVQILVSTWDRLNHHQADISVHGHGMFSAYSMEPILFTIAV